MYDRRERIYKILSKYLKGRKILGYLGSEGHYKKKGICGMQCSLNRGSEASSYERPKRLQLPQKFEIPGCISSYQLLKRHSDSWGWKFLHQFLAFYILHWYVHC
jgi:hypothetical protein